MRGSLFAIALVASHAQAPNATSFSAAAARRRAAESPQIRRVSASEAAELAALAAPRTLAALLAERGEPVVLVGGVAAWPALGGGGGDGNASRHVHFGRPERG